MFLLQSEQGNFERSISIFRSTQTYVIQSRSWLPEGLGGKIHWAAYAPHASIYNPIWVHGNFIPDALAVGSMYGYDANSMWWAHALLQLEERTFKAEAEVEATAIQLVQNGKRRAAYKLLGHYQGRHAQTMLQEWHRIFAVIVTRFRDGYNIQDLTAETLSPKKLFYPKEWLKAVGWFDVPNSCGVGQYEEWGNCVPCPPHSNSVAHAQHCTCIGGWHGDPHSTEGCHEDSAVESEPAVAPAAPPADPPPAAAAPPATPPPAPVAPAVAPAPVATADIAGPSNLSSMLYQCALAGLFMCVGYSLSVFNLFEENDKIKGQEK
eukprot:g44904.t1